MIDVNDKPKPINGAYWLIVSSFPVATITPEVVDTPVDAMAAFFVVSNIFPYTYYYLVNKLNYENP